MPQTSQSWPAERGGGGVADAADDRAEGGADAGAGADSDADAEGTGSDTDRDADREADVEDEADADADADSDEEDEAAGADADRDADADAEDEGDAEDEADADADAAGEGGVGEEGIDNDKNVERNVEEVDGLVAALDGFPPFFFVMGWCVGVLEARRAVAGASAVSVHYTRGPSAQGEGPAREEGLGGQPSIRDGTRFLDARRW